MATVSLLSNLWREDYAANWESFDDLNEFLITDANENMEEQTQPTRTPKPKKKKWRWLKWLLALIVIGLAAGGGYEY